MTTSEPHATAFQRFLPTGPIALLPVRDGFSNIVWTTTVAEALRLESLGPEELALLARWDAAPPCSECVLLLRECSSS